jgi:hypothetical protein
MKKATLAGAYSGRFIFIGNGNINLFNAFSGLAVLFHFQIKLVLMFDLEMESAAGCRGEMRSISEARRNHAFAAADKSKLRECGFDL